MNNDHATNQTRTRTGNHDGSCHCGAVRFRAQLDLGRGATRCNCSICTKLGVTAVLVKPAAFTLLVGAGSLGGYQWGAKIATRYFCKVCGVLSTPRDTWPRSAGTSCRSTSTAWTTSTSTSCPSPTGTGGTTTGKPAPARRPGPGSGRRPEPQAPGVTCRAGRLRPSPASARPAACGRPARAPRCTPCSPARSTNGLPAPCAFAARRGYFSARP